MGPSPPFSPSPQRAPGWICCWRRREVTGSLFLFLTGIGQGRYPCRPSLSHWVNLHNMSWVLLIHWGARTALAHCNRESTPPGEAESCCHASQPFRVPIPPVYLSGCLWTQLPANCKIKVKGERHHACALQGKQENVFRLCCCQF